MNDKYWVYPVDKDKLIKLCLSEIERTTGFKIINEEFYSEDTICEFDIKQIPRF